jgi:hypothetical protein
LCRGHNRLGALDAGLDALMTDNEASGLVDVPIMRRQFAGTAAEVFAPRLWSEPQRWRSFFDHLAFEGCSRDKSS